MEQDTQQSAERETEVCCVEGETDVCCEEGDTAFSGAGDTAFCRVGDTCCGAGDTEVCCGRSEVGDTSGSSGEGRGVDEYRGR